jgi:hypothetical protein
MKAEIEGKDLPSCWVCVCVYRAFVCVCLCLSVCVSLSPFQGSGPGHFAEDRYRNSGKGRAVRVGVGGVFSGVWSVWRAWMWVCVCLCQSCVPVSLASESCVVSQICGAGGMWYVGQQISLSLSLQDACVCLCVLDASVDARVYACLVFVARMHGPVRVTLLASTINNTSSE